jgi:hypothetical protein
MITMFYLILLGDILSLLPGPHTVASVSLVLEVKSSIVHLL